MNCYNHIDQPAVGTCIDCGKGLCSECSNKYTIFICDSCNLKRLYTEKSSSNEMGYFYCHCDLIHPS